jgi:hypothetical protein
MKRYSLLGLFMMLLALGACTTPLPESIEDMPDVGIPAQEMNKRISLSVPKAINFDFKIGKEVAIAVEVSTNDQIAFDHNYGARLFTYGNNQWVEIRNLTKYPDGYLVISPKEDNPLNVGVFVFIPLLPDPNKATTIRVFLVGHIYQAGKITEGTTGGYIDIDLKP